MSNWQKCTLQCHDKAPLIYCIFFTVRCNRFEVVQKVESDSAKLVTEVKINDIFT